MKGYSFKSASQSYRSVYGYWITLFSTFFSLVSEDNTADKDGRSSYSQTTCHSRILARFLSFSGHVALRHMVHLDVNVLGEIKRRQGIEENDKEKEKQANKTKGVGNESSTNTFKVKCEGILPFEVLHRDYT